MKILSSILLAATITVIMFLVHAIFGGTGIVLLAIGLIAFHIWYRSHYGKWMDQ